VDPFCAFDQRFLNHEARDLANFCKKSTFSTNTIMAKSHLAHILKTMSMMLRQFGQLSIMRDHRWSGPTFSCVEICLCVHGNSF